MWILFRGTDQIGQYDLASAVYRRINTDSTFSDPVPRPWVTHAGKVPPPPPLVAKQQAKAKEVAARAAEERAQQAQAAAEKSQAEQLFQKMPDWSIYAAGGGVAGLALLFGFASQARKK